MLTPEQTARADAMATDALRDSSYRGVVKD